MELRVGPDPAERAALWIAKRVVDAIRRRGTAAIALSGGSTAPPMIEALLNYNIPWKRVNVYQVDERIAPDGDEARNANQLAEFPASVKLLPVDGNELATGARRYGQALPSRLDVVHLGIGTDGHTASWPPEHPEIAEADDPVMLVPTFNGYERMTLTKAVVNAARSRIVLVTGKKKASVVQRWILRDTDLPITKVKRTQTWVFLDDAAAPPDVGPALIAET